MIRSGILFFALICAILSAFFSTSSAANSWRSGSWTANTRRTSRSDLDTEFLDAFRKALVSILKEQGHKPNEKFNRALDEIEKALASVHGNMRKYRFNSKSVQGFRNIMEMAAKSGKIDHFRQALGRAIYANLTAKATEQKRKGGRWRAQDRDKDALLDGAKKFLIDIKSDIGEENFEQLVSVNGEVTLVFVIDTTGSMTGDIAAAKAIAQGIITHKREVPVNFILSQFNDPEVKPIIFRDETQLSKAVQDLANIKVNGGGDCPEKTFEGMMNALYYSPMPGSAMYVFTDASPKDATEENIENVKALAIDLGIPIYFFATGNCNNPKSIDSYRSLAEDTGGLMFPLKTSNQIIRLSSFVEKNLKGGATLSANNAKNAKQEMKYSISVDDTIATLILTVTASGTSGGITFVSPDNIVQSITHDLKKNIIFDVSNPKPGNWTLTVPVEAGDHEYFVRTISKLSIDFSHYYFMYPRRTIRRHIPVGHPLLGEDAMVMIKVSEMNQIEAKSLRLRVIYKSGEDGGDFMLHEVGDSGMRYRATIKLHKGPYKLQLRGTTKAGYSFTRLATTYDEAKPFRLRVVYARKYILPLGRISTLFLAIENPYPAAERRFMFNVTDTFGYADYKGTKLEHGGPFLNQMFLKLKFQVPKGDTANVNKSNRVVVKAIGQKSGAVSTLVMYLLVSKD